MKAIMITVRLWWFYLTYKGIKKAEIRRIFAKDFKGKIFECVSKTNWKKDLMKIPEEEREFFKQFVGKVGLCFECDKVEEIICRPICGEWECYTKTLGNFETAKASCLENREIVHYLKGKNGYAIHITKVEPFDKPKEISEFYGAFTQKRHERIFGNNAVELDEKYGGLRQPTKSGYEYTYPLTRAPQSYCYIEI